MHKLIVTNQEGATQAIARGIDRALSSHLNVLWLLSGGSNIAIELAVLARLKHASPQTLSIGLIDERFVPPRSPDNNWHKLLDGGLDNNKATLIPPIVHTDLGLEAAAEDYRKRLSDALQKADAVIAQFGIGPDGHTAGILPHSPGVHEEAAQVIGYKANDFERITTTPSLFRDIDLAIGVAMGEAKGPVLERMSSDVSADDQPAQLLLLAKELIIYTDQQITWS